MSALENPRYEAFAQSRARGAFLEDAYEDAGYTAHNGHSSRVANRVEVRERISELHSEQARAEEASPRAIIEALVRMARAAETSTSPAGAKEARINLLEALRLQREISDMRRCDRENLMIYTGYASGMPYEDRPSRAKKPPVASPPTAIEPPSDRPSAAIEPPADSPPAAVESPSDRQPTAVPAC